MKNLHPPRSDPHFFTKFNGIAPCHANWLSNKGDISYNRNWPEDGPLSPALAKINVRSSASRLRCRPRPRRLVSPRPAGTARRLCPRAALARPHARTPARTNARSPRGSAEEFAEQILEFMTCAQYSGRRSTTARRKCLRSLHSIAYFPHGTEACVGGTASAAQWRARPAYIYDNKQPMGVRAGVTRKAVAQ